MTDSRVPRDTWYEMFVAARLRFDGRDWPEDYLDDQLQEFMDNEVRRYEYDIEQRELAADADDEATFEAPTYLLDSLTAVSAQISELEEFRNQLIAFARSYAIDPESMRVTAAATGLSHSTIMRIASETAVRRVARIAGPAAESALAQLSAREDPDLYARFAAIASQARQAERP